MDPRGVQVNKASTGRLVRGRPVEGVASEAPHNNANPEEHRKYFPKNFHKTLVFAHLFDYGDA